MPSINTIRPLDATPEPSSASKALASKLLVRSVRDSLTNHYKTMTRAINWIASDTCKTACLTIGLDWSQFARAVLYMKECSPAQQEILGKRLIARVANSTRAPATSAS